MAYRTCLNCFIGYSDEEGRHDYEDCLRQIDTALDTVVEQVGKLTRVRRFLRTEIAAGRTGRKENND